ncbi:MAG: SDR family oxidoreductase [Gemmatimonadetes bacterium]|nr:SDR family oxidoreductase [Gemmatimonadota bacterium]NNM35149.1 SDR family oxidoreductase [Gemmatimonadota bacterium]
MSASQSAPGRPIEGQTVIVTGAAQGLGAAIARHFHALGARLILLDRNEEALAETASACPGSVSKLVDLADADSTDSALNEVVTGPVDTLIHNAAILPVEPLEALALSTFQATMDVAVQAAFQLTKAVWPGMKESGGALVYVSSRSGIEGFAGETAYCAAKHALEGFSKSLALEGQPHGILSVTTTPGMHMRTPMSETTYPPDLRETWVEPDRLAPAFAFLATRPMPLTGLRVNAWELAQVHGAAAD